MSLEIIDAERGISRSKLINQNQRNINHKHRQIGCVINRELVDVHKIFQSPKLFSVAEVELDLETEAIIVNQFVKSQFQITTEKDDGAFLSFEVDLDDDDNIELSGKSLCHIVI